MSQLDQFFGKPGDDTLGAAIQFRGNRFGQGRDLRNPHLPTSSWARPPGWQKRKPAASFLPPVPTQELPPSCPLRRLVVRWTIFLVSPRNRSPFCSATSGVDRAHMTSSGRL